MTTAPRSKELTKPIAGLVFVAFWVIAIALWIVAGFVTDPVLGGFVVDTGIVFASLGFAALFITSKSGFVAALVVGLVAIALFALAGFLGATVVVYTLRMLVPFLALLTPLNKALNGFRIFA